MQSREANVNDSNEIFEWRNDPVTRLSFFSKTKIDWNEHQAWFKNILADENSLIIIVEDIDKKLGVVRYDKKGSHHVVSLNTNPEHRGKGLSADILLCSEEIIKNKFQDIQLQAEVLNTNLLSKKTFSRAGYELLSNNKKISKYVKFLKPPQELWK
ncbi:MAG: GNAT family N-acetyltransferase [Burkholderiaceae bacterium]